MAPERGSEALRKRLDQPAEISADQLRKLVDSADAVSARILNWEILGKPGLEWLHASFSVAPERLPAFVDHLVRGEIRHGWEVFPEGVPPFIDQYRIELGNLRGR